MNALFLTFVSHFIKSALCSSIVRTSAPPPASWTNEQVFTAVMAWQVSRYRTPLRPPRAGRDRSIRGDGRGRASLLNLRLTPNSDRRSLKAGGYPPPKLPTPHISLLPSNMGIGGVGIWALERQGKRGGGNGGVGVEGSVSVDRPVHPCGEWEREMIGGRGEGIGRLWGGAEVQLSSRSLGSCISAGAQRGSEGGQ